MNSGRKEARTARSGAGVRAPTSGSATIRVAAARVEGLVRVAGARDEPLATSERFRALRRAETRDLGMATHAALPITWGIISDIGPLVRQAVRPV